MVFRRLVLLGIMAFCRSIAFAQPSAQVSPSSIDFGPAIAAGCPFPCVFQTITIANPGNTTLNFTGFSITGDINDFFIGTDHTGPPILPTNVLPGQSVHIDVSFQPNLPGPQTATLVIQDDAAGSPQQIPLRGSGVGAGDWNFDATTGHNTATIHAGQTVQNVTRFVAATGFQGVITYVCTGLPQGSACSAGLGPNAPGLPSPLGLVTGPLTSELDFYVSTTAQGSAVPFTPTGTSLILVCLLVAVPFLVYKQRPGRMILATAGLFLICTVVSCGGKNANPNSGPTPPGTYQITFTITSGNTSRSTQVTMTVQ